jgi:acetoin utilization protein AcuB
MRRPTVGEFMTPSPLTISSRETLAEAHALMRRERIRHLPVLEGKRLVGVVSQSDLRLVETLKDVDPAEVTVGEAMSAALYTARPAAQLGRVCAAMARLRIGSTVVVERGKPVGVFTTVDALRVVASLLAPRRKASARRR